MTGILELHLNIAISPIPLHRGLNLHLVQEIWLIDSHSGDFVNLTSLLVLVEDGLSCGVVYTKLVGGLSYGIRL